MKSICLFLVTAALLFRTALAQAAQENDPQKQCNDTDYVLVEIHLNNTEESVLLHCNADIFGDCNNRDASYDLFSKVDGDQNQSSLEVIIHGRFFPRLYDDAENVIRKVSHCVPRDQCIVATTTEVPPGQISFYRDGESMEVGPTFATREEYTDVVRYITTTEMGPCKPECDEDQEVLWEMDMYLGWDIGDTFWVVESLEDGQIMADCRSWDTCAADPSYTGPIRTFRQCLPANQCYRVVALLPEYPRKKTLPMFFPESTLNITVQGKQEAVLSSYSYAAHEFSAGECPIETEKNQKCKPDESLFEMFVKRGHDEIENSAKVLFWNVTKYDEQEDIYHSFLAGEFGTGVGGLHYAQGCLPKNKCFNATIAAYTYDDSNRGAGEGWYRLVLDGIIYYDNMYNQNPLDVVSEDIPRIGEPVDGFVDVTRIGDCASRDCPGQNNALFELSISTSNDKPGDLSVDEWSIGTAEYTPEVENYYEKIGELSGDIRDGEIGINAAPGTSYRRFACVPNDLCTEFETDLNTAYFSYKVIVDGKERTLEECENRYNCLWKSQPWGNSCPKTDELSKGAVAAIGLGCVAFLFMAGMALFIYYHRRHREMPNNKEDGYP